MTWFVRIVLGYTILLWLPLSDLHIAARCMTFILVMLWVITEAENFWQWRAKALEAEQNNQD